MPMLPSGRWVPDSGNSGYQGVPNLGPDYSNSLNQMQRQNQGFYDSTVQPLMSPTYTQPRFQSLAGTLAGQTGQYSAGLGEYGGAAASRQTNAAAQLMAHLEDQRMQQLMQAQGLYGNMQNQYSNYLQGGQNRADQFYRGNQLMDYQKQQAGQQNTMDWTKTIIQALPMLLELSKHIDIGM